MPYFSNTDLDKTNDLGESSFLINAATGLLSFLILIALVVPATATSGTPTDKPEQPEWVRRLQEGLLAADQAHSGELGVYVKDLDSGVVVSLRAEEPWYLASGVKVPVAIAILREVEREEYTLDTKITLAESDYVDGAGQTNWQAPGSDLEIRFLFEQMLTVSDNTASDMLIRQVGVDDINQLLRELVPHGFGAVTTLADVRRHAYSGFHPDAFNLIGKDFLAIRNQRDEAQRIEILASILGVEVVDFAMTDLDSAFAAYYATNLNGGELRAYGDLLEALVEGRTLSPDSTKYLLSVLFKTETGGRRIKAKLPDSVAFAHKTGTQHRRACDLGVAMGSSVATTGTAPEDNSKVFARQQQPAVLIVACSRDFTSLASAESALRAVGAAVADSGLLDGMK